ncbi:MAG: PQQ-dependent sugar dehydrogenase, partial [Actinomycetes bacterium]
MTLSRRGHHRIPVAAAAVLTLALVAGCGGAGVSHTSLASSRSARAAAKAAPQATVQRVLARNLNVPWGVVFLPGGDALVSSRDAGTIGRVSRNGGKTTVGRVPGVVSNGRIGGEAGLLGLALAPDFRNSQWLYAYVSTRTDNRVVRMRYRNGRLGALHVVLKGIPR